jgi:hypothetical protein
MQSGNAPEVDEVFFLQDGEEKYLPPPPHPPAPRLDGSSLLLMVESGCAQPCDKRATGRMGQKSSPTPFVSVVRPQGGS